MQTHNSQSIGIMLFSLLFFQSFFPLLCFFFIIVNGCFHSYSNVLKRWRAPLLHTKYHFYIHSICIPYFLVAAVVHDACIDFVLVCVCMFVCGIFVFIFVALPILLLFGFFVSGYVRRLCIMYDVQMQYTKPNKKYRHSIFVNI